MANTFWLWGLFHMQADLNADVRGRMINSGILIIDKNGKDNVSLLFPIFENYLNKTVSSISYWRFILWIILLLFFLLCNQTLNSFIRVIGGLLLIDSPKFLRHQMKNSMTWFVRAWLSSLELWQNTWQRLLLMFHSVITYYWSPILMDCFWL